MISIF